MTKINTRIFYQYRDGANYKQFVSEVVSGQVTFQQISAYLECGEFFIASQVGLPDPQAQIEWSEEDHVFVELSEQDFEPTNDAPTVKVTGQQLVANFQMAGEKGWDVRAGLQRIGILP